MTVTAACNAVSSITNIVIKNATRAKYQTTLLFSGFLFFMLDQHQDKYDYNQSNYGNNEMLHIKFSKGYHFCNYL